MDHNELFHLLRRKPSTPPCFDRSRWRKQSAVLRDVQWHPFKQQVLHLDFSASPRAKMHLKVPLHFVGADRRPSPSSSAAA